MHLEADRQNALERSGSKPNQGSSHALSNPQYIPSLDGIRAIAALMVMWFHFFQDPANIPAGNAGEYILKFNSLGQSGVDLFFVLSGFLITRILISQKGQPGYLRNFYARRSLRILPLYYFFLLVSLFVVPLAQGNSVPNFSESWWWFVYLQNIPLTFDIPATGPGHYWSLAVEEHFYLFWPLLIMYIPTSKIGYICILLTAFSIVLRMIFIQKEIGVFYFTLTRFDSLSLGAFLAVSEMRLIRFRLKWNRIFGVLLLLTPAILLPIYVLTSGSGANLLQIWKPLALGVSFSILLGFALTSDPKTLFSRFLSSHPMRFLGRISYGLYVYHVLCFFITASLVPFNNALALLPISFLFSILVALASFHLLEKPFLRLKRFF